MKKPIKYKIYGGFDMAPNWCGPQMFKLRDWCQRKMDVWPDPLDLELPDGIEGYEIELAKWVQDPEGGDNELEALNELLYSIQRWFDVSMSSNVIRIEELAGIPKDEIDRKYNSGQIDQGNMSVEGRPYGPFESEDGTFHRGEDRED